MSDQIKILQESVEKPLQELKRELKKSSQKSHKFDDILIPEVFAIQEEKICVNEKEQKMHRIFVRGNDHKEYCHVGWLLKSDVDNCLICAVAFGMFCYKYYCWACGNVVCYNCLPFERPIEELEDVGPQFVCSQCCWGQVVAQVTVK